MAVNIHSQKFKQHCGGLDVPKLAPDLSEALGSRLLRLALPTVVGRDVQSMYDV